MRELDGPRYSLPHMVVCSWRGENTVCNKTKRVMFCINVGWFACDMPKLPCHFALSAIDAVVILYLAAVYCLLLQ